MEKIKALATEKKIEFACKVLSLAITDLEHLGTDELTELAQRFKKAQSLMISQVPRIAIAISELGRIADQEQEQNLFMHQREYHTMPDMAPPKTPQTKEQVFSKPTFDDVEEYARAQEAQNAQQSAQYQQRSGGFNGMPRSPKAGTPAYEKNKAFWMERAAQEGKGRSWEVLEQESLERRAQKAQQQANGYPNNKPAGGYQGKPYTGGGFRGKL